MKALRFILTLAVLLAFSNALWSQGKVVNNGKLYLSEGTSLIVQGDFHHKDSVKIENIGVFQLTGHFYADFPQVFFEYSIADTSALKGRLIFAGDSVQHLYSQKTFFTPAFIIQNPAGVVIHDSVRVGYFLELKSGGLYLDDTFLKLGVGDSLAADARNGYIRGENHVRMLTGTPASFIQKKEGGAFNSLIFGGMGLKIRTNLSADLKADRYFTGKNDAGPGSITRHYKIYPLEPLNDQNDNILWLESVRFFQEDISEGNDWHEMGIWMSKDNGRVWRLWSEHEPVDQGNYYELIAKNDSISLIPGDTVLVTIGPSLCEDLPPVSLGERIQYFCPGQDSLWLDGRLDTAGQIAFASDEITWYTPTDTLKAPFIQVWNAGTYRVAVTNAHGCTGYDQIEVRAVSPPIAKMAFYVEDSTLLEEEEITILQTDTLYFKAESRDTNAFDLELAHYWNFGDINDSLNEAYGAQVDHRFSKAGVFESSMVAENEGFCSDSASAKVYVFPAQLASFEMPGKLCAGDLVQFVSTSGNVRIPDYTTTDEADAYEIRINAESIRWIVIPENAQADTLSRDIYEFENPGSYEIIHSFTASNQYYESRKTVLVGQSPEFTVQTEPVCLGNPLDLTVLLPEHLQADSLHYSWHFPENSFTFGGPEPVIFFDYPNRYTGELTITNTDSCSFTQAFEALVLPVDELQDIDFEGAFCFGNTIQFSAVVRNEFQQADTLPLVYNYLWQFSDGEYSDLPAPEKTFEANQDSLWVSLALTAGIEQDGVFHALCEQRLTKRFELSDSPETTFSVQISRNCALPEDSVYVLFQVENPQTGRIYTWNNGEKGSKTEGFFPPGIHVVSLQAEIPGECTAISEQTFTVEPAPFVVLKDTAVCQAAILDLEAFHHFIPEESTISWYRNGRLLEGETSTTLNVNESAYYQAQIISPEGCETSAMAYVQVQEDVTIGLPAQIESCEPIVLQSEIRNSNWIYRWFRNDEQLIGDTLFFLPVAESGNYRLEIITSNDCIFNDEVYVQLHETFSFSLGSDISFCSGDSVYLASELTDPDFTYRWWNENDEALAATPGLWVSETGIYRLEITNVSACSFTDAIRVLEEETPHAAFSVLDACPGDTVQFYNQSAFESVLSFEWDFGDGNTSTEENPAHFYRQAGEYEVRLTVGNSGVDCDSDAVQLVVISEEVTLEISAPDTVCLGEPFVYSAHLPEDYSVQWIFGDGQTAFGISTAHAYLEPGRFTIFCEGINPETDCSVTQQKEIYVLPSEILNLPDTIRSYSNEVVLSAPRENVESFAWYAGNELISQQADLQISENGVYRLEVTFRTGCTATDAAQVLFLERETFSLGEDLQACEAVWLDAGAGWATYEWSDGSRDRRLEIVETGIYEVRVSDDDGNSFTDEIVVEIEQVPELNLPDEVFFCTGQSLTLSAGEASSYIWTKNGQTVATTQSIVLNETGSYQLEAFNRFGCSELTQIHVYALPVPASSFDVGTVCQQDTVEFRNTSLHLTDTSRFSWDFGDGHRSEERNPTHVYQEAGTFEVQLGVANGECWNVYRQEVQVFPAIDPSFSVSNTCRGELLELSLSATDLPEDTRYFWNFGDGSYATVSNPQKSYAHHGGYTIELMISTGACTYEYSQTVAIEEKPLLDWPDTLKACGDRAVLDAGNAGMNYRWSDGSTERTLIAEEEGAYSVQVYNHLSCILEKSMYVKLQSPPEPESWQDTVYFCENVELNAFVPGAFYEWSSGETASSIWINQEGMYSVTIWDSLLCENTKEVLAIKRDRPEVDIPVFVEACRGDTVWLQSNEYVALWSTGEVAESIAVTQPGWYGFIVENQEGCNLTDSVEVFFHELPDLGLQDTLACGPVQIGTSVEADTYHWATGQTSPFIWVEQSGDYILTVNRNGCLATDTIEVRIAPELSLELGSEQSLCAGESVILDAGNTGSQYQWSNGSTSQIIEVANSGRYWVWVTSPSGCRIYDEVNIRFEDPLIVDLGEDRYLCEGQFDTLDATQTVEATYVWTKDGELFSTEPLIIARDAGHYAVSVSSNEEECMTSAEVYLSLEQNTVTANFLSSTEAGVGDLIQLIQLSEGEPSAYHWDFGDGEESTEVSPLKSFYQQGDYLVTLTAMNQNCTDIKQKVIRIQQSVETNIRQTASPTFISINEVNLYPNPNQGTFTLALKLSRLSKVELGLFNPHGLLLHSQSLHVKEIEHSFEFHSLSGGLYILKLNIEGQIRYLKFVKH